jgi:hypothetical protein
MLMAPTSITVGIVDGGRAINFTGQIIMSGKMIKNS